MSESAAVTMEDLTIGDTLVMADGSRYTFLDEPTDGPLFEDEDEDPPFDKVQVETEDVAGFLEDVDRVE